MLANRWFEHTFSSRLNNKRTGAIVVVMQRLHPQDLSGFLLEKGGWELLELSAIAPVIWGTALTFMLMQLIGIPLSIFTVLIIPLVMGIGVDDGIHLTHRWLFENPSRVGAINAVVYSGRAVMLTSLTTMAGFGSLMLADNRIHQSRHAHRPFAMRFHHLQPDILPYPG